MAAGYGKAPKRYKSETHPSNGDTAERHGPDGHDNTERNVAYGDPACRYSPLVATIYCLRGGNMDQW